MLQHAAAPGLRSKCVLCCVVSARLSARPRSKAVMLHTNNRRAFASLTRMNEHNQQGKARSSRRKAVKAQAEGPQRGTGGPGEHVAAGTDPIADHVRSGDISRICDVVACQRREHHVLTWEHSTSRPIARRAGHGEPRAAGAAAHSRGRSTQACIGSPGSCC